MNTAVINVKVNPQTKKEAQMVAEELGISLSGLVNGFLKNLVRTKTISFMVSEEPSEYLLQSLKESKEDINAGRVISFKNPTDALSYLDKIIDNEKKSGQN